MILFKYLMYGFEILAILSAFLMISVRDPVVSVLSLLVVFLSTSAIWILLQAEFLALILILVYVGAVLVLFLFSIMMLDIEQSIQKNYWTRGWPIFGLGLVGALGWLFWTRWPELQSFSSVPLTQVFPESPRFNLSELATALYQNYSLGLEIVGILLLLVIVAVTVLVYRGPRHRKYQNPAQQVRINAQTRIQWMD